jgi:hypothetical protein
VTWLIVAGCALLANPAVVQAQDYITWDTLEPDTWASIWLIKHHIDRDANIRIVPTGQAVKPQDGMAFAVFGAPFYRSRTASVYEQLLAHYQIQDPQLQAIGSWMHALEINPWQATDATPHAEHLATLIRELQGRYPQRRAPPECYAELFDRVYKVLSAQQTIDTLTTFDCQYPSSLAPAARSDSPLVAQLPIAYLLNLIAAGQRVVFVDVREAEEFAENHIAGAVNLTLRDLTPEKIQVLKQADWVVSYCKKDFRGYEMAQALAQQGIVNSAVMLPYGIAGWQSLKLPIKKPQQTEADAVQQLHHCAQNSNSCLKGGV